MDMLTFENVLQALSLLADPGVQVALLCGAIIGLICGAAPGLTATAAIAVVLPLTYGMDVQTSLALLLGIYCSGYFAGSIPAILINTPGAPGNAATTLDGFPMAQRGEGNHAITLAIISSFIGGCISLLLLATIAPYLARIALTFTSAEYFSLALLGIVCVAGISRGSMAKGLAAALFGVFFSTFGLDPISGVQRMTFGSANLLGGIPIIAALIGLFAISEMLVKARRKLLADTVLPVDKGVSVGHVLREHWQSKGLALKSSVMGTLIGVLPGTGPAIASFIAYGEALRNRKAGDRFGEGDPKGIIACETSNNAVTGGALVPLLTLGIPGDPITAILIGALMIQGVEPGPFFIRDHSWLFIAILFLLFLSNVWMVVLGLSVRRYAAKVCQVPDNILVPVVAILAAAGGFAVNNSSFDLQLIFLFGVIGYLLMRFGFPVAAVVLGIVLGPIIELNLRNALIGSQMDFTVFFTRPISAGILIAMVVLMVVWTRSDIGKKTA